MQKPILYSTPMVGATLKDLKLQTRRIMKPQPYQNNTGSGWWHWNGTRPKAKQATGALSSTIIPSQWHDGPVGLPDSPYGQVGDVLWVREKWRPLYDCRTNTLDGYTFYAGAEEFNSWYEKKHGVKLRWKPSIHMPKVAARLWLQIMDMRIERLHDISAADAIAEGIECFEIDGVPAYRNYIDKDQWFARPQDSFKSLWQSINGADSWHNNPWVWVIGFKRIEKPASYA